jgi:hypothetical protein
LNQFVDSAPLAVCSHDFRDRDEAKSLFLQRLNQNIDGFRGIGAAVVEKNNGAVSLGLLHGVGKNLLDGVSRIVLGINAPVHQVVVPAREDALDTLGAISNLIGKAEKGNRWNFREDLRKNLVGAFDLLANGCRIEARETRMVPAMMPEFVTFLVDSLEQARVFLGGPTHDEKSCPDLVGTEYVQYLTGVGNLGAIVKG